MRPVQLDQTELFYAQLKLSSGKTTKKWKGQSSLRVCRSVVAAFSHSWKKQRELVVAQEQKGLPIYKLKVK